MIYKIFAIRDVNVGFNNPFCEVNEDVARRGFGYSVKNNDIVGFAPGDFDLYCIGEYDTDKGTICAETVPVLVCHATEVV